MSVFKKLNTAIFREVTVLNPAVCLHTIITLLANLLTQASEVVRSTRAIIQFILTHDGWV